MSKTNTKLPDGVEEKHIGIGLTIGVTAGVVIGSMSGISSHMAISICLGASFGMLASILIPALMDGRNTKSSRPD